jgi:hypothetical protein
VARQRATQTHTHMKLELVTFNADNTKSVKSGKPTLSVSYKSGTMSFSRIASETLGIKGGDNIEIHQDKNRPKDWYFSIGNKAGFPVNLKDKAKYGGGLIRNTTIARKIIDSLELEGTICFLISLNPIELSDGAKIYAIITNSAK